MFRARILLRQVFCTSILWIWIFSPLSASTAPPKTKWIRVSSDHFSVLTDADEKRGREVAVRFEQMRAAFGQLLLKRKLNISEPLEIIALKDDKEYASVAPIQQGEPISAPAFFLAGPDRNFIVLSLFEPDSWLAVSHQFAHLLLNYNYPPTQPWFDEGFAEYFSSIHLQSKEVDIGTDPELIALWNTNIIGNQTRTRNSPRSLTELLSAPVWLTIPDLFTMHEYKSVYSEGTHHTLLYAQSWMVVHYLLNQNKLAETGTYFDLVENQKLPVDAAIQQAFHMSGAEFDKAVKDYFKSLKPLFLAFDVSQRPDIKTIDLTMPVYQVAHLTAPLDADDVGTSTAEIQEPEARATVDELDLRIPERRQKAVADLHELNSDTKTETAVAHRALAWEEMEKNDFEAANTDLGQASQLDPKDPWVHYYLALSRNSEAHHSGEAVRGLSNIMQDLRAVTDWNPEFAEAYNMMAMARFDGGGFHAAQDAILPAIRLSPRNENYLMNLALIYLAEKKWDDATALLTHLKASENSQIAKTARKDLEDLPTLKKYGILPQAETEVAKNSEAPTTGATAPKSLPNKSTANETVETADTASESSPEPAPEPQPDKRPIKSIKGILKSVDCTKAPAALLTVSSAGRTMKLRTPDYASVPIIGEDKFACEWKDRRVAANYKAGGQADGDLVSLEF